MHELAVTDAILQTALAHADPGMAAANHAGANCSPRITRIRVRITELSHLTGPMLQTYFEQLARGTAAEKAVLDIVTVQPEFTCNGCGTLFGQSLGETNHIRCPHCGSSDCTLVRGVDYELESIEVET